MRKKHGILVLTLFIATALVELKAQQAVVEEICYNPNLVKDSSKKSIKSIAYAIVNGDSIKINYHSPGVRKRIIWGGLVPFDEVWVTGAHDATTIELHQDFMVGGKLVAAGKYAFFTMPGSEVWTLIINKNWKQHLATEYEEDDDVVRIKVAPSQNPFTERLQYYVENEGKKVVVSIAWEKLKVSFDMMPAL